MGGEPGLRYGRRASQESQVYERCLWTCQPFACRLGKCTRITSAAFFALVPMLVLGFALQISMAFSTVKALIGVTTSIICPQRALACPRVALLVPFSKSTLIRRTFVTLLAIYLAVGIAGLRFHHPPIDIHDHGKRFRACTLARRHPYERNTTHQDLYTPQQAIYGPGLEVNGRVKSGVSIPATDDTLDLTRLSSGRCPLLILDCGRPDRGDCVLH